jgi:prepilin-type N-terminal cleavage/methylation domain-containing protein
MRSPGHRTRGFTLVEMFIVAALISLFAGIAVFNIQSMYERNKQKAAVGECRQISTALSHVYDDTSIFPRLSLLRFNLPNLLYALRGLSVDALEYHGLAVGDLEGRLNRSWKGAYLSMNYSKVVKMQFTTAAGDPQPPPPYDWPADPWFNPYVVYLLYTQVPAAGSGGAPTPRFLERGGQKADYFAGVVSYGRNRVPGQADLNFDVTRMPLRLYTEIDPRTFQSLPANQYNADPERINMIRVDMTTPPLDGQGPRIREQGSDDLVVEF